MNELFKAYPETSAHITSYVDVLGVDMKVGVLLKFGGADLCCSENPYGKSRVKALAGREKTHAFCASKNPPY